MNPNDAYMPTARAYADGVRVLFAPSGIPTGERGGRGPKSPKDLAEQADRLSPLSAELTRAAEAQLSDEDPMVRAQASTRLLAKAMTDLEISSFLLQAAVDEEEEVPWVGGEGSERSVSGLGATEERLRLLLGEIESDLGGVERGEMAPKDIKTAQGILLTSIEDTLSLISERAGKTGQAALGGLLGLGVTQVAKAAGVVGMNIAQALGQAEKVTRLYNLFRDFAIKAYDSLVALLGKLLAQKAAKQVVEWVEELKEGKIFSELLERLYGTKKTNHYLKQLVSDSQVDLVKFVIAIQRIDGLDTAYYRQIDLSDKLLKGLKFLALVPVAALPQCKLLMAALYIILGTYVVLAGADYVDSQKLMLLDRVPGVRRVVEINLVSA